MYSIVKQANKTICRTVEVINAEPGDVLLQKRSICFKTKKTQNKELELAQTNLHGKHTFIDN